MNGTISAKIKTGGGTDPVTGNPIPATFYWDVPVDCKYKANLLNNRGRSVNGTFQQASYEITTTDMTFQATIVKLFDNAGNMVCEKEVMSQEVLDYVKRVKIVI